MDPPCLSLSVAVMNIGLHGLAIEGCLNIKPPPSDPPISSEFNSVSVQADHQKRLSSERYKFPRRETQIANKQQRRSSRSRAGDVSLAKWHFPPPPAIL